MQRNENENIRNVADTITMCLGEQISQCIKTMCVQYCAVPANPKLEKGVAFGGMVVIVPFSGTAQGYCIMAMEESLAASLLESHLRSMAQEHIRGSRDEYSGLCQEILNVAVGETMVDLERRFGDLSYFPSFVVFGDIVFPPLLTARVPLATAKGSFCCAFMLDMAKPKLAQKLVKIADDLSQRTLESITDGLTKVYNRSHFEQMLRGEIELVRQGGENLGIIMADIDHFKALNDTHGHGCGDKALKGVAEALRSSVTDKDFIGRYGGDEFIIALSGQTPEQCAVTARRIRSYVSEFPANSQAPDGKESDCPSLTISMGVTNLEPTDTYEELLTRVDGLLYNAKRAGRDTFVCG